MNAVEFQHVAKSYAIYESPGGRLTELATLNRLRRHRDFLALDDVSFSAERGETFCIIGQNGAGKSTLLQIVAGILTPTSGRVEVNGRVAALLELGAGFNPEFTGRDNVYLNAAIMGLSKRQIDQRLQSIEDFAEIGDFVHQPVKTYSSGMLMRLAFGVAIHVDPEVLLVDEALAVGDFYFRQRCMRKVHELRARGVTILFVSHAVNDVRAIGDRALWLDHGRVAAIGGADEVVTAYLAAMAEKEAGEARKPWLPREISEPGLEGPAPVLRSIPNIDQRRGDGGAEIIGIGVFDRDGRPLPQLEPCQTVMLRVSARANRRLARPVAGFVMRNHLGLDFAGADTEREGTELGALEPGEIVTVDFVLDLPELYPAAFSFSPFIADSAGMDYTVCDRIDNAIALQMARSEQQVYGYMYAPCRVEVNARLRTAHLSEKPLG